MVIRKRSRKSKGKLGRSVGEIRGADVGKLRRNKERDIRVNERSGSGESEDQSEEKLGKVRGAEVEVRGN